MYSCSSRKDIELQTKFQINTSGSHKSYKNYSFLVLLQLFIKLLIIKYTRVLSSAYGNGDDWLIVVWDERVCSISGVGRVYREVVLCSFGFLLFNQVCKVLESSHAVILGNGEYDIVM